MDAVQKSANAVYTFRLLAFAPMLRELDYFSPKRADMRDRATHIYTTLYVIKNRGAMAFETGVYSTSKLANARQEKKRFDFFIFTLKKFSPTGGTRYSFSLGMSDVLIGDVRRNVVLSADHVFITFGQATMDLNYDSNDETVELDRTIHG